MKAKRIHNIVFYRVFDGNKEIKKACIFYHDGSVKDCSFDDGLDACEQIVKERNITTSDAFKEMINREVVHVMSLESFKERFNSFVSNAALDKEMIQEAVEEEIEKEEEKAEEVHNNVVIPTPDYVPKHLKKQEETYAAPVEEEDEEEDEYEEEEKEENNVEYSSSEDPEVIISDEKEEPKKEGFFKRQWRKIKESSLGVKVTCFVLGALVACGLMSCTKRQSLEGQMFRSNLTTQTDKLLDDQTSPYENGEFTTFTLDKQDEIAPTSKETKTTSTSDTTTTTVERFYDEGTKSTLIRGNNDYYDNYTYEQLLAVTQNETQKRAMTNVHDALYGFNEEFAEHYLEKGKDIRAALTFDEVVALQQAYNDYTKEQIRAIFNGAEVNASKMENDYKSATLQLMGAHVLENSEHPVDMSMLLETKEGKEFYARYHEKFLAAKEAKGDEKLKLVKEFYDYVRADFPITDKDRTTGISHADRYASLESYKISVVPMIAASEMLFQNLKVDYTLNDQEVAFFNDVGLCNVAGDKYKRIESITLACGLEDNTNPLYEQYRNSMIKYLKERNHYVIDDAHRELTELDRFHEELGDKINPNGKGSWVWVGGSYETTETHTETKTWTETTTEVHTETTVTEAPIPEDEKAKIDAQIDAENEAARRAAEEAADAEQKRLQEEADKEAEEIKQEVIEDEQDMQERIEDANEQIDKNNDSDPSNDKPVNESDFGDHNVDFYDEHEDGNGNLNDSVENITTDPTGDQTGEPLPDPNETGAEFDRQAEEFTIPTEIEVNTYSAGTAVQEDPIVEAQVFVDSQPEQVQETVIETPAEPVSEPAQVQERIEEHHEEPAPEPVHVEEHHEEPAPEPVHVEEHHSEPAPEPVHVEEHHSEPAPEPVHVEEHHEEPVFTPVEVPHEIHVDENTSIEIPSFSNEEMVDPYLDSLENSSVDENGYAK